MLIPLGFLPTLTVAMTLLVVLSITLTVLSYMLVTYTSLLSELVTTHYFLYLQHLLCLHPYWLHM